MKRSFSHFLSRFICDAGAKASPNNLEMGDCTCENRLFISKDCKTGFLCESNVIDGFENDGCLISCPEGQIAKPDYAGAR